MKLFASVVPALVSTVAFAAPGLAAEQLLYGKEPGWVVAAPTAAEVPSGDAPVTILLVDQQIAFDAGRTSIYTESRMRIDKPEGLAAGNLSFSWEPQQQAVTVHKVHIRRAGKIIDVLGGGQSFTVLRRETNLEAAMLDGTLTANLQPEGLRDGDVIELAMTVEHVDDDMKGYRDIQFAMWNGMRIARARARVLWPNGAPFKTQFSAALPAAVKIGPINGREGIELNAGDVQPLLTPRNAPPRFQVGRIGEVSNFSSWSAVADLMAPLYAEASKIPASGTLRDELEKIRAETSDPQLRTDRALALVQSRIRYVALSMGRGGYVPASAQSTWERRFGDCKAKTALLIGLLRELGIEAAPVLVNSALGDVIRDRLPAASVFDHVIVRAQIGRGIYWLDGTRSGDARIANVAIPNFGWGLPLVAHADLVEIVPPPATIPDTEWTIDIDASAGALAPARVTYEQAYRGDNAIHFNASYLQLAPAQRDEMLRRTARRVIDSMALSSSSHTFDKDQALARVTMKGTATLDWSDGWYFVPGSTLALKPDFTRPQSPSADAPVATSYPNFTKVRTTIRMPPEFFRNQKMPADIRETVAGVEYARTVRRTGDVLTVETAERTIAREIPFKDAVAAAPRLKALYDSDINLRMPAHYGPTTSDKEAIKAQVPAAASEFMRRGVIWLDEAEYDRAIADFDQAAQLEPKSVWPIANRALARVWKRQFEAAEKDFVAAQAIESTNPVLLRAQALHAQFKRDHALAIKLFSQALEEQPRDSFALGYRAISRAAIGENDGALADSAAALTDRPGWMQLRIARANVFVRMGKPKDVAREAELLIKENPQADFAHVAAAKIYHRLGRREDAMAAFDRALAIKQAGYIYFNRADVRPRSDLAGRMADVDQALKLDPQLTEAIVMKARLLADEGRHPEALQWYDRALAGNPGVSDLWLRAQRAIILHKSGRTADAQEAFQRLRALAKTAAELNELCWTKATANVAVDSAVEECNDAIRLQPESGAFLDSLGLALLRAGKLDAALATYDRAVAKEAGASSLMGRGLVHSRRGDKARAAADLREARKLDKDIEAEFAGYGLSY